MRGRLTAGQEPLELYMNVRFVPPQHRYIFMLTKKILVGGCFNSIHPGHIYFLQEAKKLASELIVVLTNDKNNKKPYAISVKERKKLLKFLNIADKILIGDPKDKTKVVKKIKPDIIALGYDQKIPEGLENFKYIRIKKLGTYSTKLKKGRAHNY